MDPQDLATLGAAEAQHPYKVTVAGSIPAAWTPRRYGGDMVIFLLVLLLLFLLLGGFGFILHILWWGLIILAIVLLVRLALRR